jgi:hypothetical protein
VLKAKAKTRAKAKSEADVALLFCGSWLACDADNSVYQADLVDAIAGKPAPTFDRQIKSQSENKSAFLWERACSRKT